MIGGRVFMFLVCKGSSLAGPMWRYGCSRDGVALLAFPSEAGAKTRREFPKV